MDRTLSSKPQDDYCIWSKIKNNHATTKTMWTLNHSEQALRKLYVLLCGAEAQELVQARQVLYHLTIPQS